MVINFGFLLLGLEGIIISLILIWMYKFRHRFQYGYVFRFWVALIFSVIMGAFFTFMAFFEHLIR